MADRTTLKRVDDHLREKRRNPAFRDLQELDEEKLKVAKVIVGERIRRRLSQAALAKQLGVTQQQVSKLESGDFDNLATLQKTLITLGYQVKVSAIRLHRQHRTRAAKP
jgi:DNA-binding XRE family transcriptional regulator